MVDLHHYQVLSIVVCHRYLALVSASSRGHSGRIEWATKNRRWCTRNIAVEREHPLIEPNLLRLRGQRSPGDPIDSPKRKLLHHILLICGRRERGLSDQGQRDADAFIVRKEEQLVLADGPTDAYAKLIHGGTRLSGDVIRGVIGVEKVIFRVEQRSIP